MENILNSLPLFNDMSLINRDGTQFGCVNATQQHFSSAFVV